MEGGKLIEILSAEFWEKTSFSPNLENVQPFSGRLQAINIEDLIVFNFLKYQGTYLESFLLAIFPFWKDFELHQWKQIFEQLEGDELAEYYMKVSSDRLLGIDPGFQSTKNLAIIAITSPDEQLHNASAFLPNSVGRLRDIYEKYLRVHYALSFDDLINVNRRLRSE